MSTDTKSEPRTTEKPDVVEPGDHEKFAHYVDKEKLAEAIVFGIPLMALCGKVWIPTRDASKFPVCPDCKEIWEGLDAG